AMGRFDAARNLTLGTAYVHMVVATSLISNASGVHLYYFTIASVNALIFAERREPVLLVLAVVATVLFMACQTLFAPENVPLAIPAGAVRTMYAFRAITALTMIATSSYLFRLEIDR